MFFLETVAWSRQFLSFKSIRKIGHFLSVKDSVMFQQGVQILRVSGWEFYMTLCYFAIFRVSTPLINKNKVRCILPFVLVKIHNHQWFFWQFPKCLKLKLRMNDCFIYDVWSKHACALRLISDPVVYTKRYCFLSILITLTSRRHLTHWILIFQLDLGIN